MIGVHILMLISAISLIQNSADKVCKSFNTFIKSCTVLIRSVKDLDNEDHETLIEDSVSSIKPVNEKLTGDNKEAQNNREEKV